MNTKNNGNSLPTVYSAVIDAIPDPDMGNRVTAILCSVCKVEGATEKDVGRQLAQPAEELRTLANESPAVCDSLVNIVEGWHKRDCLAMHCLVAQVVGSLIVDGRLDRAQRHARSGAWSRVGATSPRIGCSTGRTVTRRGPSPTESSATWMPRSGTLWM